MKSVKFLFIIATQSICFGLKEEVLSLPVADVKNISAGTVGRVSKVVAATKEMAKVVERGLATQASRIGHGADIHELVARGQAAQRSRSGQSRSSQQIDVERLKQVSETAQSSHVIGSGADIAELEKRGTAAQRSRGIEKQSTESQYDITQMAQATEAGTRAGAASVLYQSTASEPIEISTTETAPVQVSTEATEIEPVVDL